MTNEVSWLNLNIDKFPDTRLKLEEGDNYVRIITNPAKCYEHWVQVSDTREGKTGKIRWMRAVCPGEETCPICLELQGKTDDRRARQQRYIFKIINRNQGAEYGHAKLLVVGPSITKQLGKLAELANSNRIPKLKDFDIDIVRGPANSNPLYTVHRLDPQPLTDQDKQSLKSSMNKIDHLKEATVNTPDEIARMLRGEDIRNQQDQATQPVQGVQATAPATIPMQATPPVVAPAPTTALPQTAPPTQATPVIQDGAVSMNPLDDAVAPTQAPVQAPVAQAPVAQVPAQAPAPAASDDPFDDLGELGEVIIL